jgi:hypothetical protein
VYRVVASKNAFGRSSTRLRALQAVVQDLAISESVVLSLIETLTMRITKWAYLVYVAGLVDCKRR